MSAEVPTRKKTSMSLKLNFISEILKQNDNWKNKNKLMNFKLREGKVSPRSDSPYCTPITACGGVVCK